MGIGGFQIQSARKKNVDSDFQVFGIKMTGHMGLEEKSKKIDKFVTRTKL